MPSDWPTATLGELTVNLDTRRKPVKEADRRPGPYPYYGASGVVDYVEGYLFEGEHLLIAEDGENLRTRNTPVAFRATGRFWVNNHAHIVKGNERARTRFLEYAVLAADLTPYLTGAVMPKLTQGNLNKIQIACPPLSEQDAVIGVLGTLDDRIDLLRHTNVTLESIAHALFKSWFVDFDPVRAKAEGRKPEGMDAATAELFPAEFEASALGPIPKGWKPGCIGDLADVIDCLHSKKPELLQQGRPYLQLSNIRDDGLLDTSSLSYVSDSDYEKWTSRIEASEGDCVITNVGRVGAVAQIPAGFCAAMGRNMTAIRLRAGSTYPSFLIELLLSPWMRAEIERRTDVGTILNALNVRSIPSLQFVLPTHSVLSVAEQTLRPLRASMEYNLARSAQLAKLRDTLLPRLISGKLRLAEAKEQAEDALA